MQSQKPAQEGFSQFNSTQTLPVVSDFVQRSDEFNMKNHLDTPPYFWYSPEANLQDHLKKQ